MKAPFAFFISYLSTYTVNSSLCVASGLWECMILMTIVDAAQQTSKVIEGAKPIASSTVETISSTDPTVIAVAGGILFLAYLLLLPVFSALSFSFRGYKGSKIWNAIFRMENDKDKAGISRLPSSAKNKMIQILLEDLLSKVRNLVRNLKKVEAEIVALKISFIKKVNKGSNIVITDFRFTCIEHSKNQKIMPIEPNIVDCIKYGDPKRRNTYVKKALASALECVAYIFEHNVL
ncbi:Calcium sensing receptor, chloroplastic [Capsicum annuum]|nr:Calcium sensing receptor, chloroplastic [Capsicum annuum]